ncbi:hypothetical protein L228DRAFT_167755 [Xylona heveae TC161]|uniref:Uncharacterized protein n=1 Tax=Xylona heveae (strain CBS 132557 / TC161) TaxID=1328760 RepID=A0A165FN71_XYLHT|nr:hypothetical protein L228DRAFT_167755 [Xylona heveae TC161]KZF21181.1 hypothetical protein L228DRAFT_167755 [Xylona heveae TC161]
MELEMLSNNDRAGHSSALADDSLSASKDASRCDIQLLDQEHTPNARRRLLPTGPRRHYQLDELESDLNERAIDDQEIFAFLRDYSQFKEHPSGRLFESLIWINTFAPPVVAAAAVPEDQTAGDDMMLENRQHTKRKTRGRSTSLSLLHDPDFAKPSGYFIFFNLVTDICLRSPAYFAPVDDGIIRRSTFPAEPNFSENLRLLRSLLMTSESNCFLQLCVLAAESNCIGDLFTFRQNVQASYKAQISRLYGAPRQALIHTLAKEWRIKNDVVWRLLGVNKPARTSLRLPSAGSPPPLLDLNSLTGTSFTLRWQAKSPRYSIDFDIYVWQPFRRAPPDRYAQINMLPAQDKNSRQMILLVENTNQLQRLRESLLPHSNEDDDQFLVEDKIMTSILVVFEQMVYDTTHFMEDAIDQCNNLLYEGRVRPSGSKVQFLTHLSDCLNKAVEDTAHSLLCLSEVKLFLEGYGQSIPDARISSFEKRIEGLKVDLGFLQGECRALEKRINGFDGLRTMVRLRSFQMT